MQGHVKAEQLRKNLFDAARELARSEQRQSFQLQVPGTEPPQYVAFGTKEEIEAGSSDEGWQRYGPDDVDEGPAAQ